jgi:hypothetical protein
MVLESAPRALFHAQSLSVRCKLMHPSCYGDFYFHNISFLTGEKTGVCLIRGRNPQFPPKIAGRLTRYPNNGPLDGQQL